MSFSLKELTDQLSLIKSNLAQEVESKRKEFDYELRRRRVKFERALRQAHRKLKTSPWRYLFNANPLFILSAPIIYVPIVPLILLDLFVFIYQLVCFPIYQIKKVKRSDYIVIDRHKLSYLNIFEKLNCVYCGYANGLLGYVGEIASVTEQYWCPIKHARKVANPHDRYWDFTDYADAQNYVCDLETHRKKIKRGL